MNYFTLRTLLVVLYFLFLFGMGYFIGTIVIQFLR